MTQDSQLLYIKLILLAAETYNKIPLNDIVVKEAVRFNLGMDHFKDCIHEIKTNFPKFKQNKHFRYFEDFQHKTNWVSPRELPRNSPGVLKVVVDKEEDKEEDKDKDFLAFWNSYPKKKAKANAEKAFKKLNIHNGLLEKILKAIERQKRSEQWKKDNGQFIPFPATWLNGKRWEDSESVVLVPQERKPNSKCEGCSGSGKLPDGRKCWCF